MGKLRSFFKKQQFILPFFVLLVFSTAISQQSRMKDKFFFGAFNNYYMKSLRTPMHYNWYSDLSYNAMQNYSGHFENAVTLPDGSHDGGFFENLSNYYDDIYTSITEWGRIKGENSLIYEREKVFRPAFGQRSFYKVMYSNSQLNDHLINPGYGFLYKSKPAELDTWYQQHFNKTVYAIHCSDILPDNPGVIASQLYENRQQVNNVSLIETGTNSSWDRLRSDVKGPQYPDYRWFIKPRMRIDSAYGINHPEEIVAQVKVINFNNNLIKTIYIKCKNFFRQENFTPKYYDGNYTDKYYFDNDYDLTVLATELTAGATASNTIQSQVDYQIEWPGTVDVWIEGLMVDDEWAHYLFTDSTDAETHNRWGFHAKLQEEISAFSNSSGFGYFWIDEIDYNNMPCVAEVNRLVKKYSGGSSAIVMAANTEYMLNFGSVINSNMDRNELRDTLISSGAISNIWEGFMYPFTWWIKLPHNVPIIPSSDGGVQPACNYFERANNSNEYNASIQEILKSELNYNKAAKQKAKDNNLIFNLTYQVHSDEGNIPTGWGLREPTNEEISVQAYLGLALGAQHMLEYAYYSGKFKPGYYTWGLMEIPDPNNWSVSSPRIENYYGQQKWNFLKSLNSKIKTTGDYIYPPGNPSKFLQYENTLSVNDYTSGNGEIPNSYIKNIKSIYRDYDLQYRLDPTCASCDPIDKRYWEIGFFNSNEPNDFSKHFLAVNKRCTPEIQSGQGDLRTLYIKFDPTKLIGFNNWCLIDPINNITVATFDKNTSEYINAGEYQPGEGKLMKLAPVMQEGGNFVCNESFGNLTVNCQGNVNTNGYNLLIFGNTTVEFNYDCEIIATDCSSLDIEGSGINAIKLQGKNGAKWKGINIINVESVIIGYSSIKNVKGIWALNLNNCPNVFIGGNTLLLNDAENNQNLGAIVINNNGSFYSDVELQYNDITVKNCVAAIALINSASTEGYANIEQSNIICEGSGGMGFLLTNTTQVIFTSNPQISGFNESVHSYCSDVNFFENSITSNKDNSIGLSGYAWSEFNLANAYGRPLSGFNNITNQGNNCVNVKLDRSAFEVYRGTNNININFGTGSYNFYGSVFNSVLNTFNFDQNCFNGNNGDAIHYLTDTIGSYVYQVQQGTHNCNVIIPDKQIDYIVDRHNFQDTIYKSTDTTRFYFTYPDYLYRFIIKNLIKKNFDSVIVQCSDILTNYPNYTKSYNLIPKLYAANLATDSTEEKILLLKNYFEQLILSNSQNVNLVQITNYFIQKCKVALEQYQSALAGFEDIISQNPYNQIGVLASWDYAATYLLMDTLPSSGGYNEYFRFFYNYEYLVDSLRIKKLQKYDNYDKSVFTSAERKELFKKTGNVLIDERNKQIQKVNDLQNELNNTKSDIKKIKQVKKDLEELKTIKELVKVKKPKTQTDYVNIVSQDISKMVKGGKDDSAKDILGLPLEYKLSQNYPNPFNPVTKINYELPKDGKVKLVIYDILGREMKTLVNNEFKTAGRYTVEFNGTQFASGVYFYRIQVEGGKSYTAVKKMVLVK